jgi:hypothetical protein
MTDEKPRFRLVPRDAYTTKREKLSLKQLERVEEAEREIARDPDHDDDRWASANGGMIDYSASDAGLMIEFQRDERPDHLDEVELVDLIDETAASRGRRWPVDRT